MTLHRSQRISLDRLVEAEWNANRVPPGTLKKIRESITRYGVVENLVARAHPTLPDRFEVLSGNHRLRILRDLGHSVAAVVVVDVDDAHARLLAETLNNTRGQNDQRAYAALVDQVLATIPVAEAVAVLPETEMSLDRLLRQFKPAGAGADEIPPPPKKPRSKAGAVYELGAHRLMCGDATKPEQVAELLAGDSPVLMATDPPYGVSVDHTWRDGRVKRQIGTARSGKVANDDRADWREAYMLAAAPVAYVWHSSLHAHTVHAGLLAAGYEVRQQIIWVKTVAALSRAAYHWQHEACWYAVRKGATSRWKGGRKQTTVWEAASPIGAFAGGQDDVRSPHPTQKPVSIFERPILNHSDPGEIIYDPFAGSGTALIAAETTGRRALLMELDPVYCDVIRERYKAFAGKHSCAAAA